jgi:SprT protein
MSETTRPLADMHTTLTPGQIKQLAVQAVRAAEQRAREYYAIRLPEAVIDFSLRGRCAGQAKVERSGATSLRINLKLLTENLADFLAQTIPHEVSHLVINWQARKKRQRPRPHGPEWQLVMQNCYGLQPVRCHTYQTSPARCVPRNFLYRCNCREHRLTSIMHNKLSQRYNALCKSCRTQLKFVAELAR